MEETNWFQIYSIQNNKYNWQNISFKKDIQLQYDHEATYEEIKSLIKGWQLRQNCYFAKVTRYYSPLGSLCKNNLLKSNT